MGSDKAGSLLARFPSRGSRAASGEGDRARLRGAQNSLSARRALLESDSCLQVSLRQT